MLCVDKIKYEHLAILFISPKIIPMSHRNIYKLTNEGLYFAEYFSLSFGT